MGEERRGFWGWLTDPKRQFRMGFFLVGGGIAAQALLSYFMLVSLEVTVEDVLNGYVVDPTAASAILESIRAASLRITALAFLMFILAVVIALRVSHNIYGPIVPIRRHIQKLAEGDTSSRLELREGDHLYEIAEDLNLLAEKMSQAQ